MQIHNFNLKREAVRLLPVMAVAGLILIPDSSSAVVWFAMGISLLLVGMSHLLRKFLFPYLDLERFAEKASETAVGAAIIFASVAYILSTIISSSISLLR